MSFRQLYGVALMALAIFPAHSLAEVPPKYYVSSDTKPSDIGIGDYFSKWVLPVMDFEQRDKFEVTNHKIRAEEKSVPRIVFLGDSITEMWADLEALSFSAKPHRIINRGISGQLSIHMLMRFQADVLSLNPDVVVILAGTNDVRVGTNWTPQPTDLQLQRLKDNLLTMIDALTGQNVGVIVCTLPPIHDESFDPAEFPVKSSIVRNPKVIKEMNDWIKAIAVDRNVSVADYYTALRDEHHRMKQDYSTDGLHPNALGYKIMSRVIGEQIDKKLSTSR